MFQKISCNSAWISILFKAALRVSSSVKFLKVGLHLSFKEAPKKKTHFIPQIIYRLFTEAEGCSEKSNNLRFRLPIFGNMLNLYILNSSLC